MTRRWAAAALVLLVLVGIGSAGCRRTTASAKTKIAQLPASSVPVSMLGLRVRREDVGPELKQFRRSYAEAAGLWSLRRGDDRIQATLQIVRFLPGARFVTSGFRRSIANQIGGAAPTPTRMGQLIVWRSTGTKQAIALWFQGRHMFLLAIRDDFRRPRTLMRRALEIRP